jgi:predicted transposase YbfD/YdcC
LAVLAGLDSREFEVVFLPWARRLPQRIGGEHDHIAVDGKSVSGSRGSDGTMVHQISAWLSGVGLVLGRRAVSSKRNEITEIPELLRLLDIRGTTVTIDAIGCQTKIAKTIIDRGGDYVLGVKANQPKLEQAARDTFADAEDERPRAMDRRQPPTLESFTETDKGHHRIETRTTTVCRDLHLVDDPERWPGLTAFVQINRRRENVAAEHVSEETPWYIASGEDLVAKHARRIIRAHWEVENSLHWVVESSQHWVRDVAVREDHALHRTGNCAANFSLVRAFALSLTKQEKTNKLGVANERKPVG